VELPELDMDFDTIVGLGDVEAVGQVVSADRTNTGNDQPLPRGRPAASVLLNTITDVVHEALVYGILRVFQSLGIRGHVEGTQ
jgi:hypothetical protein